MASVSEIASALTHDSHDLDSLQTGAKPRMCIQGVYSSRFEEILPL
jgi:hypothetical protein